SIHLSWSRTAGDQESLVQIERSLDGSSFTLVQNVGNGSTSYDDTALAANTKYYYRVREIYGSSASAYSTSANATTSPGVTGVNSPTANGNYTVGAGIAITVAFDATVIVTGTPALSLNSGGTAIYSSGSGTNT